jgi:hypothetical protein
MAKAKTNSADLDSQIWSMIEKKMKTVGLRLDGINLISDNDWYDRDDGWQDAPFVVSSNVSQDWKKNFTEQGFLYCDHVLEDYEDYAGFCVFYGFVEALEPFAKSDELKKKIKFIKEVADRFSSLP